VGFLRLPWHATNGSDMTALSLRRLWTMYKKLLIEDRLSRGDQVLAQASFYAGARSTLKVLAH
jgi:hypothetical protein